MWKIIQNKDFIKICFHLRLYLFLNTMFLAGSQKSWGSWVKKCLQGQPLSGSKALPFYKLKWNPWKENVVHTPRVFQISVHKFTTSSYSKSAFQRRKFEVLQVWKFTFFVVFIGNQFQSYKFVLKLGNLTPSNAIDWKLWIGQFGQEKNILLIFLIIVQLIAEDLKWTPKKFFGTMKWWWKWDCRPPAQRSVRMLKNPTTEWRHCEFPANLRLKIFKSSNFKGSSCLSSLTWVSA